MSFQQQKINRDTPIPLYFQLKEIILKEIQEGTLQPDDLIPTEAEFCEMYDISRTTVRQAITELVNEGKLYRIKSKGTFVAYPQRIQTDLSYMYISFFQEAERMNQKPDMMVRSVQVIDTPPEIAEKLMNPDLKQVIRIKRNQIINGNITSCIESYLSYPLCDQALDKKKLEQESMYFILSEKPETAVGRVIRRISAYPADSKEAKLMQIRTNDTVILVENQGFSIETGQPVIFEYVRYVGSRNTLILDYQMNRERF